MDVFFFGARAPPDVEVDVVFGVKNISTSPGNLPRFLTDFLFITLTSHVPSEYKLV